MSWSDAVDILGGVLPRRALQLLAAGFFVCMAIWPEVAIKPLYWYADDKAQALIDSVLESSQPAD